MSCPAHDTYKLAAHLQCPVPKHLLIMTCLMAFGIRLPVLAPGPPFALTWTLRDTDAASSSIRVLLHEHSAPFCNALVLLGWVRAPHKVSTSEHDGDLHAGRSKGAVTLPLPVPQQLASAVASGPLNGFLQAAGIRFAAHCPRNARLCHFEQSICKVLCCMVILSFHSLLFL